MLHMVEHARAEDQVETVVGFGKGRAEIAQHEGGALELEDFLHDEALQVRLGVGLDRQNALRAQLRKVMGVRGFERAEFKHAHAVKSLRADSEVARGLSRPGIAREIEGAAWRSA